MIRDRSTEDDVHLVHRELDVGKQTNKSVQVEHIIAGYSWTKLILFQNQTKKIIRFAF